MQDSLQDYQHVSLCQTERRLARLLCSVEGGGGGDSSPLPRAHVVKRNCPQRALLSGPLSHARRPHSRMFLPPVASQHILLPPLRMDGRGLSVADCEDPKTSIQAIKDFLKNNDVKFSKGAKRRSAAQLRGIAIGVAISGGACSSSVAAAADPSPAAAAAAEAEVELAKLKLQTTQANNATKIELAKLKLEHAKVKADAEREAREDAAERRSYQQQQLIQVSGNSRAGENMAPIRRRRGGDGKNQERSRSALAGSQCRGKAAHRAERDPFFVQGICTEIRTRRRNAAAAGRRSRGSSGSRAHACSAECPREACPRSSSRPSSS